MHYFFHCSVGFIDLNVFLHLQTGYNCTTRAYSDSPIKYSTLNVRRISSVSTVTIAHHECVQLPICPRTEATYCKWAWEINVRPRPNGIEVYRRNWKITTVPVWRTNRGQVSCYLTQISLFVCWGCVKRFMFRI